jgi:hypothetical protein
MVMVMVMGMRMRMHCPEGHPASVLLCEEDAALSFC